LKSILIAFLVLSSMSSFAEGMECKTGPVNKSFGGTNWLVYACNDEKSVVIVSGPGNPAIPFYFSYMYDGKGYRLSGEGAGNKEASEQAYSELSKLNPDQISELYKEASGV